jgi:hypothetical protein
MRAATSGLVCVILAAGCSASGAETTTKATTGSEIKTATGTHLDCNAIGDSLPTPDLVVVLDRIALPSPRARAEQTARQQEPAPPLQTYFAKAGLGVKAGTTWRLTVASKDENHLRIGWGSPVEEPSITVLPPTGCIPASRTGWLWYPGGYWTDRPGCYTVVVHASGRSQEVPVGVGAPCPGQEPPPEPSDS